MTQLHEILAVEKALGKVSEKMTQESLQTFKKENLFKGFIKSLTMFADDEQRLNEHTSLKLETTVDENLDYLIPNIAKYWNTVLAKDLANQLAVADIVLENGKTIAKDVPATFLLGLETKLGALRQVFISLPTLAPGIDWRENTLERAGIWKNENADISFKTITLQEFVEASPATKEHPAQVVGVKNVKNVGTYSMLSESGMVSPLDKATRLERFDEIFSAVKKARSRANNAPVDTTKKVAQQLLEYINKGTI